MKAWEHFRTITYHKFLVMKGCFKVGLYYQGIMHDLSKYMPSEFLIGAKYFQGNSNKTISCFFVFSCIRHPFPRIKYSRGFASL